MHMFDFRAFKSLSPHHSSPMTHVSSPPVFQPPHSLAATRLPSPQIHLPITARFLFSLLIGGGDVRTLMHYEGARVCEGEREGGQNGAECRERCDKFGRDGSKIHERNLQSFTHVSSVVSAASVMAVPSFAQRSAMFVQLTNR